MSDDAILDRLRRGDGDAFEAIFNEHYAPLLGLAERMLGDRASGEEAVQEVMVELWRRHESLNVGTSLRAYLFRAVRNRALNQIRHDRVARRAEPHLREDRAAMPTAQRNLIEAEIDAAVRKAVSELPPRCREVFELSRLHGLKYSEIAETMGISVKTVEVQMGKALRVVRDRLASWLPGADGPA